MLAQVHFTSHHHQIAQYNTQKNPRIPIPIRVRYFSWNLCNGKIIQMFK